MNIKQPTALHKEGGGFRYVAEVVLAVSRLPI